MSTATSARFRECFSNPRVVLPVIHVESLGQVLQNLLVVRESGCDGAFLINHSVTHAELMFIHEGAVSEHSDFWLGINSLASAPHKMVHTLPHSVRGLWTDNAGIEEHAAVQHYPRIMCREIAASAWPGLYFGGVAFKYQAHVDDVATAARIATQYMDVVTTSGAGTGMAARVSDLRDMKTAIGEMPLALASGVTPDNVVDYLPWVDAFLVATGISRSFTELDFDKTAALVQTVRSWTASHSQTNSSK